MMSETSRTSLKISEVPVYLRTSELYISFDTSADQEVSVPSDCIKQNLSISSVADFRHLLQTMQFWILRAFPAQLVEFLIGVRSVIYRDNTREVMLILSNFEDVFPSTCALINQLNICCDRFHSDQACDICAEYGRIDFLDYFLSFNKPISFNTLNIAAANGHLRFLEYVYQKLTAFDASIFLAKFECTKVVLGDHVECLKFLVKHGAPLHAGLCALAVKHTSLSCLKHLLSSLSIRESWVTSTAAKSADVRILRCAIECGCAVDDDAWHAAAANPEAAILAYLLYVHPETLSDSKSMLAIAARGSLPVLEMLHARGYAFCEEHVPEAAKTGNLVCLQFLHQQCGINYMSPSTMAALAGAGRCAVLRKLHKQGCPWDDSAPIAAVRANRIQCLFFLIQQRGVPQSAEFAALVAQATSPVKGMMYLHREIGQERFKTLNLFNWSNK